MIVTWERTLSDGRFVQIEVCAHACYGHVLTARDETGAHVDASDLGMSDTEIENRAAEAWADAQ